MLDRPVRRAALVMGVAALIGGCAGGATVSLGHLSTSQHVSSARHASPRQQADRDAQELLTHVRVPPSAKATRKAPASRLEGPFDQPSETSLVDRHLFWRVGMSVDAAAAWLRSHQPAGLTLAQNGSGSGPGYRVIQFAYEPKQRRADGAFRQLQLEVTNLGRASSAIRADALAEWLDPRPTRDTADGPRIHVNVDASCPRSDRAVVGVTNTGSDLSRALLPAATPTGGRLCDYAGGNGQPPFGLLTDTRLSAEQAQHLASAARALRLAHPDGEVISCPSDDGAAAVIALQYPDGRTVDLWTSRSGCTFVSNGKIITAGSLPGLR